MNNATTVLLVGAIAAVGAVRARSGSRLLRTDVTPTFDVGEIFARKPKPPKRCEVWLRNRANVNGVFVVGAILQVFGLGNNDAWRVCLDAHHNGAALVAEMSCPEAEEKIGRANEMARAAHPAAVGIFELRTMGG